MSVVRWIFRNFLYKVVALVVAVVLWAATQGFRSVDASVDLAVTFEDQSDELVVISQSTREVNFKLVGSRWAVRRAAQRLEAYPVSLEAAAPGEVRIQVDPGRFPLPRGAEISAWSPSNISVKLDSVIDKSVRVRPDVGGNLAEGLELEGVEVEPPVVALRGASSVLGRLREVPTERIELSNLRETTSLEVPLIMGRTNVWPAREEEASVRVLVRVVSVPIMVPGGAEDGEAEGVPDAEASTSQPADGDGVEGEAAETG